MTLTNMAKFNRFKRFANSGLKTNFGMEISRRGMVNGLMGDDFFSAAINFRPIRVVMPRAGKALFHGSIKLHTQC